MLITILCLGFVIGMQHAFEADHLAAVSALVSRERGMREMARHGAIWGIGHTITLFVVSGFVLFSPWDLPASFEPILEVAVGLMLVSLGSHVLYRLWRDRVHIHVHQHDGVRGHLHAHSHRGEGGDHAKSQHAHEHVARRRSLLVGLIHGAAGSAALTVFVAASLESPFLGIVYVLLFGLGSVLGMALLTAVIAVPLTATARNLTWAHRGLQVAVGSASIAIGLQLVAQYAPHWLS